MVLRGTSYLHWTYLDQSYTQYIACDSHTNCYSCKEARNARGKTSSFDHFCRRGSDSFSTCRSTSLLAQTSLLLLNRITDTRAMDVSDAYLRLREQILFYNNPESELERTGGLNMINTTNLSYFDSSQKAELFRLKAIFLASLRRTSKSNQAYCHSVQICPFHTKSWISWGGLCSSLGAMTEKQAEHAKSSGSETTKESRAAATKKVAQYMAQAMGCFIEAVQIDNSERSRIHLPKVLWMLTKDGLNPGVLCQTLENRGIKLPPWVWLPWIPVSARPLGLTSFY